MYPQNQHDSGFSLVELSIVLVILGLLTGGILGGQALIKAAEMRAVTTELATWQTATNTFRQKYNGLPGDLNNAEAFWGAAASCPPSPGDAALGNSTCNGNGDGDVGSIPTAQRYEPFLFWQQLSLAGMITGEYSGTPGAAGTSDHIIGVNTPNAKFGNGGWSALFFNGGSTNQYERDYGNTFVIGAQRQTMSTNEKLFTPSEAWNIDTKTDDGLPAKGSTVAHWLLDECSSADDGSSTNDDLEAHYRLEDDSTQCSLYFIDRF